MSLLSKALQEKHFDIRLIERGINKGQLTRQEVDKHASKLSDDSGNADSLNLDQLLESIEKQSVLRSTLHN